MHLCKQTLHSHTLLLLLLLLLLVCACGGVCIVLLLQYTMREVQGAIIGSGLIVMLIGLTGVIQPVLRAISPITVAANIGVLVGLGAPRLNSGSGWLFTYGSRVEVRLINNTTVLLRLLVALVQGLASYSMELPALIDHNLSCLLTTCTTDVPCCRALLCTMLASLALLRVPSWV